MKELNSCNLGSPILNRETEPDMEHRAPFHKKFVDRKRRVRYFYIRIVLIINMMYSAAWKTFINTYMYVHAYTFGGCFDFIHVCSIYQAGMHLDFNLLSGIFLVV